MQLRCFDCFEEAEQQAHAVSDKDETSSHNSMSAEPNFVSIGAASDTIQLDIVEAEKPVAAPAKAPVQKMVRLHMQFPSSSDDFRLFALCKPGRCTLIATEYFLRLFSYRSDPRIS
jgi:hypothetical protein